MRKIRFYICILSTLTLTSCEDGLNYETNKLENVKQVELDLETMNYFIDKDTGIFFDDEEIADIFHNPNECRDDRLLHVQFAIRDIPNRLDEENIEYVYSKKDGEFLNGKPLDEEGRKWLENHMAERQKRAITIKDTNRTEVIEVLKNKGFILDNKYIEEYIHSYEPLHFKLSECDILKLKDIPRLLGIGLYKSAENNSFATAMSASGVTQGINYTYNRQGQNIGIYMSEASCPPSNYFSNYYNSSNYTQLSGLGNTNTSDQNHTRNVSAILHTISPNARVYCRPGCTMPEDSDISNATPQIFIANFSCSVCNSSTQYTTSDQAIDDAIHDTGITHVRSAGNITPYCQNSNVWEKSRGVNVITVGNYNDYNNTPSLFEIASDSSYIESSIGSTKPELSAPGTDINAGFSSSGSSITLGGTSQAAPHVAGMLANIGSTWSSPNLASITPPLMKVYALLGATDSVIGGGSHVGEGGADFYRMYYDVQMSWFKGSFSSYDNADDYPNNGCIDKKLYSTGVSSNTRLVIAWITKGSDTYAHRYNMNKLSASYRLDVRDPDGYYVTGSSSTVNNYQIVNFTMNKYGYYRWKICKQYEQTDNTSDFNMAYSLFY